MQEYLAKSRGAEIVLGSSIKAALSFNWDDLNEPSQALEILLNTFDSVEALIEKKN